MTRFFRQISEVEHWDEFFGIGGDEHHVLITLYASKYGNAVGFFKYLFGRIARDIGRTEDAVESALDSLMQKGLVVYDFEEHTVLLPNFLKNTPLIPGNSLNGAATLIEDLKEKNYTLYPQFIKAIAKYKDQFSYKIKEPKPRAGEIVNKWLESWDIYLTGEDETCPKTAEVRTPAGDDGEDETQCGETHIHDDPNPLPVVADKTAAEQIYKKFQDMHLRDLGSPHKNCKKDILNIETMIEHGCTIENCHDVFQDAFFKESYMGGLPYFAGNRVWSINAPTWNQKTTPKKLTIEPPTTFPDGQWGVVCKRLLKRHGNADYNNWLKLLVFVSFENGGLKLSAPTLFMRDTINSRYAGDIKEYWNEDAEGKLPSLQSVCIVVENNLPLHSP